MLTAIVLDIPADLCLIGRKLVDGTANHSRYYIQALYQGRDTYLQGGVTDILPPQTDPLITAGTYQSLLIGDAASAADYTPTRYWGLAQPFIDAGAAHLFSLLSVEGYRWPFSFTRAGDKFAWRMVVVAPNAVKWQDGVQVPEQPTSPLASWTLDIGEGALSAVGASAITRLQDDPETGYEQNWDGAQYPWIASGRPSTFFDEDGNYGFKITIAAQVVYEEGGPYKWYDSNPSPSAGSGFWAENANGIAGGVPSGSRGLWIADIQVIGTEATILQNYKVAGGDLERTPLLIDRTALGFLGLWYDNNITYRAPVSTLENEDGTRTSVMIAASFIDRTPDYYGEPAGAKPFDAKLFLDVHWFDQGVVRTMNLLETTMARGVSSSGAAMYGGSTAAWDIGEANEGRFTIGGDTDGTTAVFPVFSFFAPGQMPLLRVVVVTRDSATVAYEGIPGFAMCVACGTGEQAIANYGVVDFPLDSSLYSYGEWISLPAAYDQVSYIGNGRFAFYVSTQLSERAADEYMFCPDGNLAIATFSLTTGLVRVEGVIDPTMRNTGFNSEGPTSEIDAFNYVDLALGLVPDFSSPPKLGRIEVLRPESDGYDPLDPENGGHPATLIASRGLGRPGLSGEQWDGEDITQGVTWISYDSGANWMQMLQYGSPAGTIHCGNIAQARSEPVVRV